MNIQKVIKNYFVFMVAVVAMGGLSYSPDLRTYMANTFGVEGGVEESSEALAEDLEGLKKMPEGVTLTMENSSANGYAAPGTKHVGAMNFRFKTREDGVFVEDLKLQVTGVDAKNIEGAKLLQVVDAAEKVLSEGKVEDGYLVFKRVNFELGAMSEAVLEVNLDLSSAVKTGDRIRLDIEKAQDMEVSVRGDSYGVSELYPVRGKYLSIAKARGK